MRRNSTNRLSTALRVSAAALVATAGTWLASVAGAVQINETRAELAWSPASGPVAGYVVFVSRNGAFAEPEQTVSGTTVAVLADFGDVLSVSVAAVDEAGNQGPRSQASEPIEFVAPPPVYYEDFEAYADAEDPDDWLDTKAENSLIEDPSLFETFELTDGTVAFGTGSSDTNIHSHLVVAGSADWTAYEFSGSMSVADPGGGSGVTLYSDYPRSDTYYWLGSYSGGTSAFHLTPHSATQVTCQGTTDTGVIAGAGIWYRFRFQALPESGGTRLRARVWPKGTGEPANWQIDCLDATGTFQSGLPGLWSTGRGIKLWDDLEVRPTTCGDVNGDGLVDTIDARVIHRCVVGEFPCPALCDVTGEGICDTIDARLVQRYASGELTQESLYCGQRP